MLRFTLSLSLSLLLSVALASGSRAVTFADGVFHAVSSPYAWITVEDGPGATTTTVNLNWGAAILTDLHVGDSSVVNMIRGAAVADAVIASDTSLLNISGGEVGDSIEANGDAMVTFSGGAVRDDLWIRDDAQLEMTGGFVGYRVWTEDNAIATIRGGEIPYFLRADNSSTIFIEGSGFEVDGIPVPYGDLTALSGTLTGTLLSGDLLDARFWQGGAYNTGTITLVPEPSTVALLGLGLAGLALRRRLST